jgi:dienelactone hydrolase
VAVAKTQVLPAPTGPYGVGRIILHWQDPSRPEVLLSASNARRELVLWIWYPATAKGPGAPYIDQLEALAGALPRADVAKARSLQTHAIANAMPSPAPALFPVLVFSPGGGSLPALYTSLCEDLASHGYLIAAIDHPYDDVAVRLADGRVVEQVEPPQEGVALLRFQRDRVRVRAQDMQFVLDQLTKLNAGTIDSPFRERLDLQHVGAFGHSVGGMTAGEACMDDARFMACANMDGVVRMMPLYPDDAGQGPKQPFLFLEKRLTPKPMRDETPAQLQERWTKLLQHGSSLLEYVRSGRSYRITVDGATHAGFSDEEILSLAPKTPRSLKLVALTREYIRAFFDESLLGKHSLMLNSPSSDPAVHIQVFTPQRH